LATTIDLAAKESEATESAIKEIMTDFGQRVKNMTDHIKQMMAEGKRPTGATLNSLTKLKTEVMTVEYMGGAGLATSVNNLISLVNAYVEADKNAKEAQETLLKEAIPVINKQVEVDINQAIQNAMDFLSSDLDVTV
jgi:predicted RNase H-like nuclease (RuvC/YqgF family)